MREISFYRRDLREACSTLTRLVDTSVLMAALTGMVVVGCKATEQPTDVVGRYVMNRGKALDEIEVRPDGKYIHYYQPPDSLVRADSGTWELEMYKGRPLLLFYDFTPKHRRETNPWAPQFRGLWPVYVTRTLTDKLRLSVDDDVGWHYERVQRTDSGSS